MLKFMYYSIGILFIFYELGWVIAPYTKAKENLDFKDQIKKYKGLKWDQYPKEYQEKLKGKLYIFLFFAWFLLGLFTFQWQVFLLFTVFQFTIVALLSKILQPLLFAYTSLHWINSIIGIAFALFVIINAYHLKIDFQPILLSLIR